MASLKITGVRKRFGSQEVLKGIELTADDGEFLVLVGPSGCGKSTLLNLIAGLERITEGEIRIGDRLVNDMHPKDRDIAMVFQSYALYPTMTVRRNITFGMEVRGVPRPEREAAVERVAAMLQIEQLLDRKPGQLSGGQRQRVAMGRALVRDPAMFLFDEPLSNLDAKLRVEMRHEIKKLHQTTGRTAVYVTHDQIEAMTLASRIAVMNDGILQQYADPATIYDRPANLFVAGFMGSPPMNFVEGRLEPTENRLAVMVEDKGAAVSFPLPGEPDRAGSHVGKPIILGIRPEAVALANGSNPDGCRCQCHVDMVEPTGADTMMLTALAGAPFIARLKPADRVRPGDRVTLAMDMSRACVFDRETGVRL